MILALDVLFATLSVRSLNASKWCRETISTNPNEEFHWDLIGSPGSQTFKRERLLISALVKMVI